jgi:hypothetical protein
VLSPEGDLSLGYEWLSSRLSDHGVTSSRTYRGVLVGADVHAMFSLSERWMLGPMVGVGVGVFDHESLDGPGIATRGAIDDTAIHLWPRAGARLSATW